MIENLISFAIFALAFTGMVLTGRVVLSRVKFYLTPGEKLVWSFVLGAFFSSLIIMLLGFAGFITKTAAYGLLGLSLISSLYRPKYILTETAALYRSAYRFVRGIKGFDRWAAVIVIAELTAVFFVVAFGPEVRFDALAYHLELPKRYIETGCIRFHHDIHQSAFPALWDVTYLYGLLLRSERISRLFAFAATTSFIYSVFSIGRRLFDKKTGLFAAVIASTTPIIAAYWSNCMADIPFTLFLLLSFGAIAQGRKKILPAALFASFFFAFATASRMQAFILAPVFAIIFIGILTALRIDRRYGVLAISIILTFAIAAAAPWYVNNYIATGNIFGYVSKALVRIEDWSGATAPNSFIESVWVYLSADNYKGPHGPWYIKFTYPFLLTFRPSLWSDGEFGPLFLALLPAAAFITKRKKGLLSLFAIVLLVLLSWVLLLKEVNLRYLIWGVPYASIIAGYVWASFSSSTRASKLFSLSLVLVTAGISAYFTYQVHEYFPVVVGARPPVKLVEEKKFGGFDAIEIINKMPEGTTILSLDSQIFYFNKPTIIGFPRHNYYFDTSRIRTPEEMLKWFKKNDITHVFTSKWESTFRFPGKPYGIGASGYVFRDDFLEVYGVKIAEGGDENYDNNYYEIYEIRYPEPARRYPENNSGPGVRFSR